MLIAAFNIPLITYSAPFPIASIQPFLWLPACVPPGCIHHGAPLSDWCQWAGSRERRKGFDARTTKISFQTEKSKLASLVGRRKTKRDLTTTSLVLNQVKNSRGLRVMGDERAQANGWGHTASPIPTAWGQDLVVPLLSGMVFVIKSDVEKLNQNALVAINDLGPLGESFTRASLTTDGKMIFAHTIQGVAAFAK